MYARLFELHAQLFKALAHPRRLEIVQLLRDTQLPVTDIHTMLDLPQANISQHLTILRDAKVVTTRRDGKQVLYALAAPEIMAACDLFREMLIRQYQGTNVPKEFAFSLAELVPLHTDPVCGMRVSARTAGFHTHYQETEYYFCASGCHKRFTDAPEDYVKKT